VKFDIAVSPKLSGENYDTKIYYYLLQSNQIITQLKGLNKLCRYKRVLGEVRGKSDGKIFKKKRQACRHITWC